MRQFALVAALALLLSTPAVTQEWVEYASRTDMFTVNFPGQPTVENIDWETEYRITIPAHVNKYDAEGEHYSVTVVDCSDVQKIRADRVKGCTGYPDTCGNPYVAELRGAMEYAAWSFLKRDAKVTYYAYGNTDRIEGRRLQLTNADGSRTYAQILMHQNRLYIFEATVPKSDQSPARSQQSVGFLDSNGGLVRYNSIYSNAYPPPTRVQY